MTKYSVWIQQIKPYKVVFGATIEVDSKKELKELEKCIVRGLDEYEQHRN